MFKQFVWSKLPIVSVPAWGSPLSFVSYDLNQSFISLTVGWITQNKCFEPQKSLTGHRKQSDVTLNFPSGQQTSGADPNQHTVFFRIFWILCLTSAPPKGLNLSKQKCKKILWWSSVAQRKRIHHAVIHKEHWNIWLVQESDLGKLSSVKCSKFTSGLNANKWKKKTS